MRDRRLLTLDEEAIKRDARAYRVRISESLAPAAVSPAAPQQEKQGGARRTPKRNRATPARKKPARRS